jgi:hypothetical protein
VRVLPVVIVVGGLAAAAIAGPERDWSATLLDRADDVAKEVSKLRGLKQKKPIKRDVVDEAELRKRLVERATREKNAAELAAEARALRRWGLIPDDADYSALIVDVLTEQIAGFYDPEDETLYIAKGKSGEAAPADADLLLAHEIDHALQDQHFDLEKFTDISATEGDALLARRALVEGDGVVVMLEVVLARDGTPAPWSDPEIADTLERSFSATSGMRASADRLAKAPLVLREQLLFPYRAGLRFVAELRRRQPWSKVNAAFAKPPRSTEQILHPDAYVAGDDPVPVGVGVPRGLDGWDLGHHTVWGEAGVTIFFAQHGVDAETAAMAAAGWGGDRVALFVPEAGTAAAIGVLRSVWDSEADAIEAEEAFALAVDRLVDGTTLARGRWLGLDGRLAWVERAGTEVTVVVGAPLARADGIAAELPAAMKVGKKP